MWGTRRNEHIFIPEGKRARLDKIGTHLTVCGEMASGPTGGCLLAALGATNLSVQPDAIHPVRFAISKLNVAALRTMLPPLFDLESADEVEEKIRTIGL